MSRWLAAPLAALLGLAVTLPAHAQWKWLDKARHVQYSDLPPPSDIPPQDILQRPAGSAARARPAATAASTAPPLEPKTTEPELDAKRRKAQEDEAAAKRSAADEKLAAARAENCKRAKSQMQTLDSGIRIARTNDKGEREILDDSARADEVRRTQSVITSDCK